VTFTQAEENYYVNLGLSELPTDEIEKLKLEGNIVLGDFIFNTIDENGVVWVITDIDGWWSTPDADVPEIERAAGDGGYDVSGRYESRSIQLEGSFLVTDPSKVEAARDKLVQAANLVYEGAWLKTGSNPIKASYVYLVGNVETEVVNTRGRTDFSISLRASDPIKYQWDDSDPEGYSVFEIPVKNTATNSPGTRVLSNDGNYRVPCFLEIIGPFSGPGTVFNRTTQELIILTQGLRGTSARSVVNKELAFNLSELKDIATLTTTQEHGFRVGDFVVISNVGENFDGEQVITSIPTSTTFTFDTTAAEVVPLVFKELVGNQARIETTEPHGFSVGNTVIVDGVDAAFDGTHVISSVPSERVVVYDRTRSVSKNIVSTSLTSNIATIFTSDPHEFIVGESVTITGAGVNFNGTYEIISIPGANSFTCAITRTNSRSVVNKSMSNDVVTLTTSDEHGLIADEPVNVTNVDLSLNGGYFLEAVTPTTFSYTRPRSTQKNVSITARAANVATITTSLPHGFAVGERVKIENVDGVYNGTFTITGLPSITTFTFALPGGDLVSTSVTTGTVRAFSRKIDTIERTGNIVTVVTDNIHGVIFGERVTIAGHAPVGGTSFDGTYTVSAIPLLNTFEFQSVGPNVPAFKPLIVTRRTRTGTTSILTTENNHGLSVGDKIRVFGVGFDFDGLFTVTGTPAGDDAPAAKRIRYTQVAGLEAIPSEDSGGFVGLDYGYAELPGTINSTPISPAGFVQASGSLPFSAATGFAEVLPTISRRQTAGNVIKENNVRFTPGLSGATAIVDADILEIDTKNKEVAFNGEISGARGRVDVLADFIQIAPGENQIEFEDTGNPESTASLKVYYRSGWLA
jgi:hypothetical protein